MAAVRTGLAVGSVLAALAVALSGASGNAASASPRPAPSAAHPPGSGWHRYHSAGYVDPKGDPCAFKVVVTVVRDQEWYRTMLRYHNGSPFVQEYTGPLWERYKNAATGKAVVRHLSGTAFFTFGKDGSLVIPWRGGGGITVHRGNKGLPPGEWVLDGAYTVFIDRNGDKRVHQYVGARENLCRTLAS